MALHVKPPVTVGGRPPYTPIGTRPASLTAALPTHTSYSIEADQGQHGLSQDLSHSGLGLDWVEGPKAAGRIQSERADIYSYVGSWWAGCFVAPHHPDRLIRCAKARWRRRAALKPTDFTP